MQNCDFNHEYSCDSALVWSMTAFCFFWEGQRGAQRFISLDNYKNKHS